MLLLLWVLQMWTFEGITPPLQEKMARSKPQDLIPVNLVLHEQLDYQALVQEAKQNHLNRKERRQFVIETARVFNQEHQREILEFLKQAKNRGDVGRIHPFLLVNAIHFEATPQVIQELYQRFRGHIRSLDYDEPGPQGSVLDLPPQKVRQKSHSAPPALQSKGFQPSVPDQVAWGVERIRAPELWDLGITGQGVILANIDTGTNYDHMDLIDHIWVNPGEDLDGDGVVMDPDDLNGVDDDGNGYVDDLIGWDFVDQDNDPMDEDGHGSHTAGIMAGDGTAGLKTGVAPDAQLMVIRAGLPESVMWEAHEYAVLMGADVISSSMSLKFGWHQPDYATWRQMMEATLAAGVIRANSIGNQGDDLGTHPIPWNIACPGNVPPPWLHPDQTLIGGIAAVMGCGAVDENDVIKYYSGRGPSAWEDIQQDYPNYPYPIPPEYWDYPYINGASMGLLKPDVVAPTDVPTISESNDAGYYDSFGGTSAATPHLGGSMALLLSVDPVSITPEMLAQALMLGAVDLGTPGKDNLYGAGRLDLVQAYNVLLTLLSDSLDPNPPESLTAYSDYLTPTSILLTWQDPTTYFGGDPLGDDLAGIQIYDADDSTLIADVPPGVEQFEVTGLTDGTFYRFYAVAYTIYDSVSRPTQTVGWYAGGHPVPSPPDSLVAYSDSSLPTAIVLTWQDPTTQLDGTPLDDLAGIRIYDAIADTQIAEVPPGIETDTVNGLTPGGLYRFYVTAFDNESPSHESPPSNPATMFAGGAPLGDYLIWDPDPNHSSGPVIDSILSSMDLQGIYTTTLDDYLNFLPNFSSLWIFVGIFSDNYIIGATSSEAQAIETYIQNGGKVYLEGGDVWYYDPQYQGGYNFGPLFGIQAVSDGSGDLSIVQGVSGSFTEGMQWYYAGENNWIDHLLPSDTNAFSILVNPIANYTCGVANDAGTYRTIGLSFEMGGLTGIGNWTLADLVAGIATFFGLPVSVQEKDFARSLRFSFAPIYPNPATERIQVRFTLPQKEPVTLALYDLQGRRIRLIKDHEVMEPGVHTVTFPTEGLRNGVYFIQLKSESGSKIRKWVLTR